jgi:hypothetical protein
VFDVFDVFDVLMLCPERERMTFKDAREVLKLLWSMAGTVTQVP